MGNVDTKLNFRKAVVQLTANSQPIDINDETFWDQFWAENNFNVQDIFTLIPALEIRSLREEAPGNLSTLCIKALEKIVLAVDNSCRSQQEQQTVLNCARLLIRLIPYLFEHSDWKNFFWTRTLRISNEHQDCTLTKLLLDATLDLLFCPDFTVGFPRKSGPDKADDLKALDSCEYIWAKGVGFAQNPVHNAAYDVARTELLKLLLTCCSGVMYESPEEACNQTNRWLQYITSGENRHALPLFTSLLNTVFGYDPVGIGVPYNHLLFSDTSEPLVEVSLQLLIISLDHEATGVENNLFIDYLSRIHRDEDFLFIARGFSRLLNNPLIQTYLPHSTKKVQFHQELLVLFWKLCDYNKKFLYHVLKSSDILDIVVPILFHLNDSRADQSLVGLMHIGVFILLLLSGERNFGVRLNKPYNATIPMDIPVFTGNHADLLIIIFHKIITTGHQRLQPLFDCILTILVNVSPYLKSLSMVASVKLLHLFEAFSTPWFLFSAPKNHHLVFFLLEIFNNIIQYQFDGNSNLVYTIIRKRQVFHNLTNLPTDSTTLRKCAGKSQPVNRNGAETPSMEGSRKAIPAEPGTLKATLPEIPSVMKITERETAHPGNYNIPEELVESGSISERDDTSSGQSSLNASPSYTKKSSVEVSSHTEWLGTAEWVKSWKDKLPVQTIMRLLQVLVPQVEKICIDKGLTDESEILKFLQHGTLVGLLPVPHPILIRKYQTNCGTTAWFRIYMWGILYLRNVDPPIWYDTDIQLFEIQRV